MLIINLSAALFLTGLSWFLQIVQLPMLLQLDVPGFPKIAAMHRRRNTLLMAGPMLIEMVTAVALLARRQFWPPFFLLIAIWIITFSRHVPLHRRLLLGYDRRVVGSIERWNWARTLCWTARAGFLVFIALDVTGRRL